MVYINRMMCVTDVLEVLACLEGAAVVVWLDGGWGVDALLGEQTRPHDDLDIVLAAGQLDTAQEALHDLGYLLTIDELPTRCVLAGMADRRIDIHLVTVDRDGGGVQQQPDGGTFRYPPEGLAGVGQVAGKSLRCLTPGLQLRCHLAYEPDNDDRHDVRLLCERFGLALPEIYRSD